MMTLPGVLPRNMLAAAQSNAQNLLAAAQASGRPTVKNFFEFLLF